MASNLTLMENNGNLNVVIEEDANLDIILNSPYLALASGSVASFSTNMQADLEECKAEFAPVQDLHGYDNPWPAGGGKNKLDVSVAFDSTTHYTINADESVTVSASDGRAWSAVTEMPLPAGTYTISKTPTEGTSDIRLSTESFETGHIFASSKTFTLSEAGSVKIKLAYYGVTYPQTYQVQIVEGTTVPSWTPYSNICPISGFTGLDVTRTGINVWDEQLELGYINENGAFVDSDSNMRSKNLFPITPSASYYVYCGSASSGNRYGYRFYDKERNYISGSVVNINTAVTSPSNAYYMAFFVPTSWYGNTYKNDISINYPTTDHDYHAYTGNTYPVTWTSQGTQYGGYVNVSTGELVATYAKDTLNGTQTLSLTNWRATATSVGLAYNASEFSVKHPVSNHDIANIKSDVLASKSYDDAYYGTSDAMVAIQNGSDYSIFLRLPDTSLTTSALINAYLANNPIDIVYELATPVTYQLTAQQIETLIGQNNVWSSANGNVTVKYWTR